MTAKILSVIKSLATPAKYPDLDEFTALCAKAVTQISEQFNLSALTIEKLALENNVVPLRYARNLKTYTLKDQARLLDSSVAVIGLGGLGGTVIEILARAGVGTLFLADGDVFEEHNLNRQLTSATDLMGSAKNEAARNRIHKINPSLCVQSHAEFLNETNAARLIGSCQVIVDCLDNITSRFVLAKAAKKLGLPLVSGAVAGLCGHITTIFPQDQGLELIYGDQEASAPKGGEASLGCLPQVVMGIGSLQGSEVLKILLNHGQLLRHRLLVMDLKDNTFEVLKI